MFTVHTHIHTLLYFVWVVSDVRVHVWVDGILCCPFSLSMHASGHSSQTRTLVTCSVSLWFTCSHLQINTIFILLYISQQRIMIFPNSVPTIFAFVYNVMYTYKFGVNLTYLWNITYTAFSLECKDSITSKVYNSA